MNREIGIESQKLLIKLSKNERNFSNYFFIESKIWVEISIYTTHTYRVLISLNYLFYRKKEKKKLNN